MAGQGPPVLLLHGAPQSMISWRLVAPDLAQDHTVVVTDLRGYGDSSKPAGRRESRELLEARDGARSGRGDAAARLREVCA